jgi:hypothetical protein
MYTDKKVKFNRVSNSLETSKIISPNSEISIFINGLMAYRNDDILYIGNSVIELKDDVIIEDKDTIVVMYDKI